MLSTLEKRKTPYMLFHKTKQNKTKLFFTNPQLIWVQLGSWAGYKEKIHFEVTEDSTTNSTLLNIRPFCF